MLDWIVKMIATHTLHVTNIIWVVEGMKIGDESDGMAIDGLCHQSRNIPCGYWRRNPDAAPGHPQQPKVVHDANTWR